MADASIEVRRWSFRNGSGSWGVRNIAEERAIAFTYNKASYAVMMATPADLEDFAVGFTLAEGVVSNPAAITSIEVIEKDLGTELRIWLEDASAERFAERRRFLAGPVGCGLCGIESLKEAMRPLPPVQGSARIDAAMVRAALADVSKAQALNHRTRAVHAAALWRPGNGAGDGLVLLREDVGRHNALDKLAGAIARRGLTAAGGIVFISSRVSMEMVQKATVMGAAILVAMSAPTALAIRLATEAGLTLIAIAREDGFEVFSGPERVAADMGDHVA